MHPLIVRNLILPIHEAILKRPMYARLREFEASQWWTADQLRNLQQRKLRRLLSHAADRCPFHAERFRAAGIDPRSATLESLRQLPTLGKSEIAANIDAIIDPTIPGGLFDLTTGGSTGRPLAFKIDRNRQAADQAARARTRRWFGIDVGERELYLWGSPVEQAAQDRAKTLRDRITNHRLLNAFRMTPAMMTRYIDVMQAFDPVHLFGYPSSIAQLVRHAVRIGRPIRNTSLKAVFVTGELVLRSDRAIIEEFLPVPVADGYGSREAGFIAHQCPAGSYHVTMESVIVELLDAQQRPVADGRPGEIVITHLDALGMPFIRYRTGDIARRAGGTCACGRGLECLERIEGRQTDMLRTLDGGYAHALSVIYVLRDEPCVEAFKVVQQPNCDLDVAIVPRGHLEQRNIDRIARGLRRQIGERADIRIRTVETIPSESSGKYRYVVQARAEEAVA